MHVKISENNVAFQYFEIINDTKYKGRKCLGKTMLSLQYFSARKLSLNIVWNAWKSTSISSIDQLRILNKFPSPKKVWKSMSFLQYFWC